MASPKTLTPDRRDALLGALRSRFEQRTHRHAMRDWAAVWAPPDNSACALSV